MRTIKSLNLMMLVLLAGFILVVPSIAQDQDKEKSTTQPTANSSAPASTDRQAKVEAGKKQKIEGVIVKRDIDKLIVRDRSGADVTVNLSGSTKIQERKGNPFRKGKEYDTASLMRGLSVEVEGRGNGSGSLDAEKVKINENDYRVARSITSRVDPVEDRVGETENRMTQAEQNAQRLSGQLEELSAVANTARGGAKAAQETADKAMAEASNANQRVTQTNERVTALDTRVSSVDDYDVRNTVNINFKVGSAVLSDEAKASLDEVANQAKNEKGYVIQVAGYASADGNQSLNRRLSERRANMVVRYLIENHDIPQRRIITPFGYGELKPAADNTTREGREQNRRVEVAILVSKGLSTPAGGSVSGTGEAQRQRTTSAQQQ